MGTVKLASSDSVQKGPLGGTIKEKELKKEKENIIIIQRMQNVPTFTINLIENPNVCIINISKKRFRPLLDMGAAIH